MLALRAVQRINEAGQPARSGSPLDLAFKFTGKWGSQSVITSFALGGVPHPDLPGPMAAEGYTPFYAYASVRFPLDAITAAAVDFELTSLSSIEILSPSVPSGFVQLDDIELSS